VKERRRLDVIRSGRIANMPDQAKPPTLEAMARAFGEPEEFNAPRDSTYDPDEFHGLVVPHRGR
jgi:hypothetical protein